jgi:hypothetical protein
LWREGGRERQREREGEGELMCVGEVKVKRSGRKKVERFERAEGIEVWFVVREREVGVRERLRVVLDRYLCTRGRIVFLIACEVSLLFLSHFSDGGFGTRGSGG